MNKIRQTLLLVLAGLLMASFFDGCKKGEDDPFISLKSRKARVAGEWTVIEMKGESTETSNGITTHCIESYNGTTYTKTCGTSPQLSIAGSWILKFNKDGTHSGRLEFVDAGDRSVMTFEGIWTFLSGVGEKKKKEQLAVTNTKTTTEFTSSAANYTYNSMWVGKDRTYNVWEIKSLKSDEMVWFLDGYTSDSASSQQASYTVTLTKNN